MQIDISGQLKVHYMHTFRGSHINTCPKAYNNLIIIFVVLFVLASITKNGEIVSAINILRVLVINGQNK
jgi:hypothetical protein